MITFTEWAIYVIIGSVIIIFYYLMIFDELISMRGKGYKCDGDGELYNLGRGCEDEDIEILLSRIYWSTYLQKRISKSKRILIPTGLITLAIIFLVPCFVNDIFDAFKIALIVFTFTYIYTNLVYVHGDIHNDGNIRKNIELIANKLDIKIIKNLELPKCKALKRSDIE